MEVPRFRFLARLRRMVLARASNQSSASSDAAPRLTRFNSESSRDESTLKASSAQQESKNVSAEGKRSAATYIRAQRLRRSMRSTFLLALAASVLGHLTSDWICAVAVLIQLVCIARILVLRRRIQTLKVEAA